MINTNDLLSIGIIRRTHYKDLPNFVFVRRDGLFVPFRSDNISELIGEEGFLLRSDLPEENDDTMSWVDLTGYTVMDLTPDGSWSELGVISHIDDSTANILATLSDGRLLPLHENFILEIDEQSRLLRLNLPFAL